MQEKINLKSKKKYYRSIKLEFATLAILNLLLVIITMIIKSPIMDIDHLITIIIMDSLIVAAAIDTEHILTIIENNFARHNECIESQIDRIDDTIIRLQESIKELNAGEIVKHEQIQKIKGLTKELQNKQDQCRKIVNSEK